jgi:hypothetical protein
MSLHDATDFFSRPLIGVTTTLSSVVVSLLPHLESAMRLGVLGLALSRVFSPSAKLGKTATNEHFL